MASTAPTIGDIETAVRDAKNFDDLVKVFEKIQPYAGAPYLTHLHPSVKETVESALNAARDPKFQNMDDIEDEKEILFQLIQRAFLVRRNDTQHLSEGEVEGGRKRRKTRKTRKGRKTRRRRA